eukprot:TRINITY_DN619_c0_g2_i1.p1 TRINITY_DN619_c0_g2~~TRINITY_DN619_c0_g2_i1.p1  ORF type:complete len:114 (-),score=24.44 TRINITY_DN619_c0_g2_i1:152-493(-)
MTEKGSGLVLESNENDSFIVKAIISMLQPGIGAATMKFLNVIFICLFLVVSSFIYTLESDSKWKIHFIIIFGLALGLFLSLNWFLYELSKADFDKKNNTKKTKKRKRNKKKKN